MKYCGSLLIVTITLYLSFSFAFGQDYWAKLTPSNKGYTPLGRMAHSAVLTDDYKMLVWGGNFTASVEAENNTILEYDILNNEWSVIHSINTPPSRAHHFGGRYKDLMIIYSGFYLNEPYTALADILFYNITSRVWTQPNVSGVAVPGLYSTSPVITPDGMLLVYGGCIIDASHIYHPTNDMYQFDISRQIWTQLKPEGTPPLSRCDHSAVITPENIMIVFAGMINGGPESITARYDISSNTWINGASGKPPSDRIFPVTCLIGTTMLTFWGSTAYHIDYIHADYAKYDTKNDTWILTEKPVPYTPTRVFTSCVAYNDTILLFGGYDPTYEAVLPDLIEFSLTTTIATPLNKESSNHNTELIVLFTILGIVIGTTFIIILISLLMRQRKKHTNTLISVDLTSRYIKDIVVQEVTKIESNFQRLGGGNFGDVYRGIWQGTTEVALKRLKSSQQMDEFEQEANILRSKDVAAGMLYLSDNQVIHRDLALRNLLVAPGRENKSKYLIKIADFGMSKMIYRDYYSSSDTNLPIKWCAPEVIHYDCWSFGVVLWEIFSYGRFPYPAWSNDQTIEKVDEGYRMPSPEGCPPKIYELMIACWSKDASSRPSFEKLFQEIENISDQFESGSVAALPQEARRISAFEVDSEPLYGNEQNISFGSEYDKLIK